MKRYVGRGLLLTLALALGACAYEPFPRPYYTAAPPPLQPYMGPPYVAASTTTRIVKKRHYRKRHHRVRCRCEPAR